jgi:hypothetical protein
MPQKQLSHLYGCKLDRRQGKASYIFNAGFCLVLCCEHFLYAATWKIASDVKNLSSQALQFQKMGIHNKFPGGTSIK